MVIGTAIVLQTGKTCVTKILSLRRLLSASPWLLIRKTRGRLIHRATLLSLYLLVCNALKINVRFHFILKVTSSLTDEAQVTHLIWSEMSLGFPNSHTFQNSRRFLELDLEYRVKIVHFLLSFLSSVYISFFWLTSLFLYILLKNIKAPQALHGKKGFSFHGIMHACVCICLVIHG